MAREVIPSGAALGADVRGIDFSLPLSADDKAFVQQAWNDHLVLRFQDQDLEDEDLIRMADDFGGSQVAGSRQYYINAGYDTKSGRVSRLPGITIVSNLDKDGKPEKANSGTGSSELLWHTDNSYVDNPPKGSILYGIQVPINGGGDTSFVNQYETYDALSEAMKKRLLTLHIRHDNSRNTAGGTRPTAKRPRRARTSKDPSIQWSGNIRTPVETPFISGGATLRRQAISWSCRKTKARIFLTSSGPMQRRTNTFGRRCGPRKIRSCGTIAAQCIHGVRSTIRSPGNCIGA